MAIEISFVRCGTRRRYYFQFDDITGDIVFDYADPTPEPDSACTPNGSVFYTGSNFNCIADGGGAYTVSTTPPSTCDLEITAVNTTDTDGSGNGSITITADPSYTKEYSIGGAWQSSNVFNGLSGGTYTVFARKASDNTCVDSVTGVVVNYTAPPEPPPCGLLISFVRCSNHRRYYFCFNDDTCELVFDHADPDPEPDSECTQANSPFYFGTNCTVYAGSGGTDSYTLPNAEACNIVITNVVTTPSMNGNNGTITVNADSDHDLEYSFDDGTSYQISNTTILPANTYSIVVRQITNTTCSVRTSGTISLIPNLAASMTGASCTANGANDGQITVLVSNGSGHYSVRLSWESSPILLTSGNPSQALSRSNLNPDLYSAVVTDLDTGQTVSISYTVTEPPPSVPIPNPNASILRFPLLNSLSFVVPDGNNDFDNTLLCQQVFSGFDQVNYFNPFLTIDTPTVQWESDFINHTIGLYDYVTDTLIRSFSVELKEQNTGVVQDFSITIRNHTTVGQSRVYFASGFLPIPLSVGGSFSIVNNADGFNGDYVIINIVDSISGQYLVINKNYAIGPSSTPGTGRFVSDNSDYNVYESVLDFTGLDYGKYYVKVVATSDNSQIGISEPIDLQEYHPKTFDLVYRNKDDGYGDITWSTGFTGILRVPGLVGHKRVPGGERSTSRNADFSLTKVNAKKTRGFIIEMWGIPPYLIEKLSAIFDCDFFEVNGVECQSNESMDDPTFIDRYLLADTSIKVEQKGWFKKYNSDDIGTVNETGFITTEQGFLKR